jgi:predicted nucleic acid-binding protein
MTTRPRLLLVDADACICAHQCDGWQLLRERYEVLVAETVVEEVTHYVDGNGQRRFLGLDAEVQGGLIQKCSATTAEQADFLARLHPGLRARLDRGEIEALAYLMHHGTDDMALVTGDGAAIISAHALGHTNQLLSLEAAYQRIGHSKRLRVDMTEAKFQEQLRRAGILVAEGRALAG